MSFAWHEMGLIESANESPFVTDKFRTFEAALAKISIKARHIFGSFAMIAYQIMNGTAADAYSTRTTKRQSSTFFAKIILVLQNRF